MREPVEASGTSGSRPEAGGRQWKSVEGVGRGLGGSEEVREVRRRSGRPWESAEEAGKAREVTVCYTGLGPVFFRSWTGLETGPSSTSIEVAKW